MDVHVLPDGDTEKHFSWFADKENQVAALYRLPGDFTKMVCVCLFRNSWLLSMMLFSQKQLNSSWEVQVPRVTS